jgi:hypothetical protein
MKRRPLIAVFALLCWPLCLGQNCPSTTVPTPAGVPSEIPPGVYSGLTTTTVRLLVDNSPQSTSTTADSAARAFGSQGEPLHTLQNTLYVGYQETQDIGGMQVTLTVTSIEPAAGGVTVNYAADLTVVTDIGTFEMTGSGRATFTLASAGSIDYQMTLDVSYVGPTGSTVALQINTIGRLYR